VEAEGAEAQCYNVDIGNREAIYAAVDRVLKKYGRVDVLLNNAGIVNKINFLGCSDELMEKTLRVNTLSLFYLTKALLPGMLERNYGHIVTVASMAGKVGVKGLVDYW
jgi:all-trans-retinol dehydrogenase (NAD+)